MQERKKIGRWPGNLSKLGVCAEAGANWALVRERNQVELELLILIKLKHAHLLEYSVIYIIS